MKYTNEDKICPHCGGNLEWHSLGENYAGDSLGVKKWCDDCGSNDSEEKPSIKIITN